MDDGTRKEKSEDNTKSKTQQKAEIEIDTSDMLESLYGPIKSDKEEDAC